MDASQSKKLKVECLRNEPKSGKHSLNSGPSAAEYSPDLLSHPGRTRARRPLSRPPWSYSGQSYVGQDS